MSIITKIEFKTDRKKYWIFIDNKYCTSIRERTFKAMNLHVNQKISCECVKDLENFHWKKLYGTDSWEKEKIRINKVKELLTNISNYISVNVIGFGADSNELIKEHPKESGMPDLEIIDNRTKEILMYIEVTGTEKMQGNTYWVRPDKLKYAQNNKEKDVWIILYYNEKNTFVYIKPNLNKTYTPSTKNLKGSDEYYVEFIDNDDEVKKQKYFEIYLRNKIK